MSMVVYWAPGLSKVGQLCLAILIRRLGLHRTGRVHLVWRMREDGYVLIFTRNEAMQEVVRPLEYVCVATIDAQNV
jgi:hypothetical protein